MRIGGLASGMDIDSLVKDLMKAERMPMDKLTQKKQILEWQRDDYRSMNSLLLTLRNETFNMKLSSKYRSRTTTSSNEDVVTANASSAASTASYAISNITQLASAASQVSTVEVSNGSKIDITKGLHSISTGPENVFADNNFDWKAGSVEKETINVSGDGTAFSLGSLQKADGQKVQLYDGNGDSILDDIAIKVDGKSYTVVNRAPAATGEVQIDDNGNITFFDTIKKGSSISVDYYTDKEIETRTISAATKEFQLAKGSVNVTGGTYADSDFTLSVTKDAVTTNYKANKDGDILDNGDNVVGKIDLETGKITMNGGYEFAENSNVKVEYKQNYFTFGMTTYDENGKSQTEKFGVQGSESLNTVMNHVNSSDVGVTMLYDSFADKVTVTRSESGDFNTGGNEMSFSGAFLNNGLKLSGAAEQGGINAKFTINGLETERTSNTFDISGVTFTLKTTFTNPNLSISISVGNDSEKVVENIKKFIEKYNETIGKIQEKTSETKYRDYQPLTDEQREGLSDKQQEMWEEKAKSGLLRRDPLLSNALNQFRSDFYNPVTNSNIDPNVKQLTAIGITTSSNYLEGGKLIIDEAKLKKAIEENPEAVEKLFMSTGTIDSEKGIATRLYESLTESMDKIKERAGSSLSTNKQFTIGKTLDDLDKRIDAFQDRLTQIEDRYWRQFTAMEKAIQQSNSQSMYLMQQFGM